MEIANQQREAPKWTQKKSTPLDEAPKSYTLRRRFRKPSVHRDGGPELYWRMLFPTRVLRISSAAAVCALSCCTLPAQDLGLKQDTLTWRAEHAKDLLKPDGWLSLVGLEWLHAGDNTVGSAEDNKIRLAKGPAHLAVIHLEGDNVTLNPPEGGFPQDLQVAGAPAKSQSLRAEGNNDKVAPRMTIGTLSMYVIRRENRFALRIKDSQSPSITGFHGLKWYPPNPSYRVTAKWIPYSPFKTVTLATLVGTNYDQPVPGAAEFVLGEKTWRLEPVLEDPAVAKLFFILRDTTSTTTTYGACRFLYTGFPTNGLDKPGELVLDFNRLENPPCAYTPYSTCPLPPQGNRLPIALPVGEQRYHDAN